CRLQGPQARARRRRAPAQHHGQGREGPAARDLRGCWHTFVTRGAMVAGRRRFRHDPIVAVLFVTRAAIRRHWRGLFAVALLVGIAGAAVLTAAAGARRTATALDRFRSYSRSA